MNRMKFGYIFLIFFPIIVSCNDDKKIRPRVRENRSEEGDEDPSKIFEKLEEDCKKKDNEEMMKCLMSSYMKVYELVPEEFCNASDENCKKAIKSYGDRCGSDETKCHTLDNFELVKLEDGVVEAPDLVQAEAAFYLFKKSGAYDKCEFPSLSCVGECNCHCDCSYVECEYKRNYLAFIQTIVKRYMESRGVNEGEENDINNLRKFVYYSCLYYLKYYLYEDVGNFCVTNRNLQKAFRYSRSYESRKRFGKMRRNNKLKIFVTYKDLCKLFDSLVVFLTRNPIRKYESVALSFSKVFRYTLIKSVPYYKHSYLFARYLEKNPINIEKFSDPDSPNGKELVQQYLERCKEGECYMFDDYKLFPEDSGDNYLVPQLSEVNLVYYLLKNCNFKYGKFNSFFTNNTRPYAEIQYMAPRLLTINSRKFDDSDSNHFILQKFLYYASIYFIKSSREWLTTREIKMGGLSEVNVLKNFLNGIASNQNFTIEKDECVKIENSFKEYLTNSYFKKHPKRVNKYVERLMEALNPYCQG